MTAIAYVDASALAKFVLDEPESPALSEALRSQRAAVVTSLLGRVEVERAARREGVPDDAVQDVLGDVTLLSLDVAVAAVAGRIAPAGLRALDAIHLATAHGLGADLDVMYCYDRRLANAARAVGIDVRSPGAA